MKKKFKKCVIILLKLLAIITIYCVLFHMIFPVGFVIYNRIIEKKEKIDNIKNAESTIASLNISEKEKREINYEELCEDIRTLCTNSGEMNAKVDYDREKLEFGYSENAKPFSFSVKSNAEDSTEDSPTFYSKRSYGDGYIIENIYGSRNYYILLEKGEKEIGEITDISGGRTYQYLYRYEFLLCYIILYSLLFITVLIVIILKKRKAHR